MGKRPRGGGDSRPPPRVCPPPTELCSAPATWEEPWIGAWRHLGSKLHVLVGSDEALVTASCGGSPGVCVCVACMAAGAGGQQPQPRGPQATRRLETSQGPRSCLCIGPAVSCVLGQGTPVPPEAVLSVGGEHVGPECTWGAASVELRGACQQQEAQLEWVAGRAAGLWDPPLGWDRVSQGKSGWGKVWGEGV